MEQNGRRSLVGAAAAALVIGAAALAAPAWSAPPTASILVSPSTPVSGEPVTFTARAQDSDGSIASYAWELDDDADFADGSEAEATRTFDRAGTFTVYLRVVDNSGEAFIVYTDVEIAEPGAATPATPVPPTPVPGPAGTPPALLDPFPVVRVAGRVTRAGARLTLITVEAPEGARIVVECSGRGCRRERLVRAALAQRRLRQFEGRYRAGARLTIRVIAKGRIGKYTRITVRRGIVPARVDRCVWPGRARPRACP